ncbi:MAG: alpha-glucosidase [Myxococcota bacterium]|nr:alpha-glucosidase [Myxococcota bacterium]
MRLENLTTLALLAWMGMLGCTGSSSPNTQTDDQNVETTGTADSASQTAPDDTGSASQDTSTRSDSESVEGTDSVSSSDSETQSDTEPVPDSADYSLGDFTVHFRRSPAPGLIEITHADEPGRILFETVPGVAFVQAKLVRTDWSETHGSFDWKEKVDKRCEDQVLELLSMGHDGLSLTGRFADCNVGFGLRFFEQSGHQLGFSLELKPDQAPAAATAVWRAILAYGSSASEEFYGFGTQYTYLSPKGRRLPILTQEQGHGRGLEPLTSVLNSLGGGAGGSWFTTYAAVPQYLTSTKRGLFLENYEFCYFDLRDDEQVQIELDAPLLRGRVLHGATMLDLIEEYTSFSGRLPVMPDWMNDGAIVGLMGGSEVVRPRFEALLAHGVPVSGLWLQDWVGKRDTLLGTRLWWNWELDRTSYPDWEELVAEMEDKGIRMLGYVNPFVSDPAGKPGGFERNYFKEAKDAGYLVVGKAGVVQQSDMGGFDGALVDFSYEPARKWFKQVMTDALLGNGMSGWMVDFGESLRMDSVPRSGEPASTFHHRYVEEWARVNREVMSEAGFEGDLMFFMRSGYSRSPKYASQFWLGDNLVSWDAQDGIKTAVTGLLSSGFSGYSLNHSDIGGYTAFDYVVVKYTRSKELLVRWMEMNAFSAVFRSHEGNNAMNGHQIYEDEDTMALFAKFAHIYAALGDYRRTLVQEASAKGYPVVRHPILHYEDDPEVARLEYEYLLGPEILIAPVLDEGATAVDVYLPKGKWVHLWSGEVKGDETKGQWQAIGAPLGYPAVFYRRGSKDGESFRQRLSEKGLMPARWPL